MANKNEAKILFTADTGKFNDNIAQLKSEMTKLRAEFSANAAEMKATGTTVEGLEKKHRILSDQYKVAQQETENLSQKLASAKKYFGENSIEANNLEAKLIKAKSAEDKLKRDVENCAQALKEQKGAADGAGSGLDGTEKAADELDKSLDEVDDSASKVGGTLSNIGGTVAKGVVAGFTAIATAGAAAVTAFLGSAEATREYRENMGKLQTAFQTSGKTAEQATGVYKDFYAVLGEEDRSVEAVSHLAKLTNSQKELDQWTTICAGVVGTFGDSLPIEGLTEAANETAKVGAVTGPLADALNWAGVSEEAFNEKLAACNSEQERSQLITSTLNGLYGEAAEKYMEMNGSIMDAQRAQSEFTDAMAGIGAAAEPVMTSIKLLGAGILNDLSPAVSLIGEGLTGALNGTEGSAEKLAEGVSGVLTTVADNLVNIIGTIADMLPSLLSTLLPALIKGIVELIGKIASVLPSLLTAILDALPDLIQGIVDAFTEIVKYLPDIIKSICDALPTLIPALINGITTMVVTLCESFSSIIQPLIDSLPDIIISIVQAIVTNLPALIDGIISLVMGIVEAIPQIIQGIVDALPTIISLLIESLLSNLPKIIAGLIQVVWGIVKSLPQIFGSLIQGIGNVFAGVWDALGKVFGKVGDWFGDKFGGAVDGIKNAFASVGEWFKGIWNGIKNAFSSVGTWFKDIFSKAWNGVKNVFGGVKNFFLGIWDKIKSAFSAIGTKIGGAISGAVKKAINGVIGMAENVINGFLKMINGAINLINKIPGVNIKKVQMVSFTRLAKGGVVDKATPAIFGEDGAEAVVPLEKNTGWIKRVAEEMAKFTFQSIFSQSTPLQNVVAYADTAIERQMQSNNLVPLIEAVEELANRAIELNINGRHFATATASDNDAVNGNRVTLSKMGLALG